MDAAKSAPKPILKQSPRPACPFQEQKHAHFPPPEQEARRFSGIDYDRSPIVVDDTSVQITLPRRGCPGRTFYETAVQRLGHHKHGEGVIHSVMGGAPTSNHPHPRKLDVNTTQADNNSPFDFSTFFVLPLVPSETSESEDSEGVISPPSEDDFAPHFAATLQPTAMPSVLETGAVPSQRRRLLRPSKAKCDRKASHASGNKRHSDFSEWSHSDSCLSGF